MLEIKGGKSDSKIQKWTKKMSNFQKRKYFMKKGSKFRHCVHKGQKIKKKSEKNVTLIFEYFAEKDLGVFSVSNIWIHWIQKIHQKKTRNFSVKIVILNAANWVIGKGTF